MQGKLWSWLGPIGLMIALLAVYGSIRADEKLDMSMHHPHGHFYIVSVVAILALFLSVAVGVAGIKLRNVNVTFLSLAFISLAAIFTVHGLSTPGFMIHDVSALPKISAQLSILVAAGWIFLSALPTDHRLVRILSKRRRSLLPWWGALLLLFGGFTLIRPDLIELLPINVDPYKWVAAGVTAALCLFAMHRYRESYELTRFPFHLGIVYSSSLLIVSQIIMVTGTTWQLSWWLYHYTLLASMLIMVLSFVRQYAGKPSLSGLIEALYRPDPRAWIASSISPSVKALIGQTEQKDAYTAGHNYRVALYGLRLAEHLGVKARLLRAMAQGGVLHDVGKLRVDDSILNKPGRLTAEERAVMEQHPVHGYNLCKRLGFMDEELGIIRSHHEKWDGTGYPDRLQGEQIPYLARIIAVADVYDALTSSRAYRTAMSHEEAMKIIVEERGRHFDPRCIDAWLSLAEADPAFFRSTRGEASAVTAGASPAAAAAAAP